MKRLRATRSSGSLPALVPAFGLPVTVCVICYGPNVALARRFLTSLYRHTDPSLFVLRAGLNEVEAATAALFQEYSQRHGNIEIFAEERNIFKNPLMRRIFTERPIGTEWTLWCDDDTEFTRPDWLQRLGLRVEAAPGISQWGYLHTLSLEEGAHLDWIRTAAWYRGIPFEMERGDHGRPQARFYFATGGFWAIRTRVLRQLDWPDPRLRHALEDVMLGEALRQYGLQLCSFEYGVRINAAERRNPDAPEVRRLV